MKAEFDKDSLVIIPESAEETAEFNRLFPEPFMRNSRYVNVRQFVDKFGRPEAERPYLLINGYDPREAKEPRPRKARAVPEAQAV